MSSADKRCSRCGIDLPASSFGRREASADGLQNYCRECVAAWAREHRPRRLADAPAVSAVEKWCRSCEQTKAVAEFAKSRAAKDGLQAHCRECQGQRYRERREAQGKIVRPRDVPEGTKFCRTCQTIKPLAEWSLNKHASDGLQTRCKSCTSADARRKYFTRLYGLSEEQLEGLLRSQGGLCAICRTAEAVHVDHDHATGAVRGMLCFSCNAALGQLRDDPALLRRAARYLERAAHVSARDEAAWAAVLWPAHPTTPSRLEALFAARLAEYR